MSTPNLSRAEANAFVKALNARALCACAVRRQLITMRVPGPHLLCELHEPQAAHRHFNGTECVSPWDCAEDDGGCIHPALFATDRPCDFCHTCNRWVSRCEL